MGNSTALGTLAQWVLWPSSDSRYPYRLNKEMQNKQQSNMWMVLALYFLERNGTKGGGRPKTKTKRLLIVYSLWSLELLREECGCTLGHRWTMDPKGRVPDLRTSCLDCTEVTQTWQRFVRITWTPSPPPLHSRGNWDLRYRQLFGPQPYFRYFLRERKWKLIQEQGFTKEAICLLDYLFACQSLSYGTG